MAENLVVYTVVHQPRRLRLPARTVPLGATAQEMAAFLFDEEMDRRYLEKVARYAYRPATDMFARLVARDWKLAIGFSNSFLVQAERWAPDVVEGFQKLCASPQVEVVCVEPYHSWLLYLDIERFQARMLEHRRRLEQLFGKPVTATDTTEMFMSNDVYFALQRCGFKTALIEGRPWQLGERDPTYLYRYPGQQMNLLCRHHRLSDDVGYRFSDRGWSEFPLTPERYAGWIRETWGNLVLLGWDFETFGEHHREDSGILQFMPRLSRELRRRGVSLCLPSEAAAAFEGTAYDLPVSEYGSTWAGDGGMEFFLANPAQLGLFRLMHHAYSKARLTKNADLLELAIWLLQSDHLHTIQWFGGGGPEAEVSAYFTPEEWWDLGGLGILREQQRVYINFIRALDQLVR